MTTAEWSEAKSQLAHEIWSDYQQRHNLTGKEGHTAGIDPETGAVWLGESIQDVVAQRDAQGLSAPLYFMRVGFSSYYRKGGRR